MMYSPASIPLLHGEVGLLDELLLFGAPFVVVIIILTIAQRRKHQNVKPRERAARPASSDQPHPPED